MGRQNGIERSDLNALPACRAKGFRDRKVVWSRRANLDQHARCHFREVPLAHNPIEFVFSGHNNAQSLTWLIFTEKQ
jgi:hypothetical protein